jgi:predicted transcriptional regulator
VNDPIAPKVKRFIDANISSVEQLELLLLLRRTKPRTWTAQSASLELRTSPQSVATRVSELAARGLVTIDGGEFAYGASSSADGTVGELERVYATYRTRVITMIFDKPPRPIRDLADAFRLRKDD